MPSFAMISIELTRAVGLLGRLAKPQTAARSPSRLPDTADDTDRARQALDQLLIATPDSATPKRAIELFQTLEIYPGSKLKHFRELHRKVRTASLATKLTAASQTGIPYSEMLFFGPSGSPASTLTSCGRRDPEQCVF